MRTFKHWLLKSLANKLAVIISIFLILSFSLVFTVSFRMMRERTQNAVINTIYTQSEVVAKEVTHIFSNARMHTEQMAINRDITTYLKDVKSRDDVFTHPSYPYVLEYISKIKEKGEYHFLAWVANEAANFYLDNTNTVPDEDYEVVKRPWYKVALDHQHVTFTYPYVEWNTKKIVISSILALREGDDIFGFVVVDIMLDSIPDIFHDASYNEHATNFLITNTGTYIYHPEEEKIMLHSIYDSSDPFAEHAEGIMKNQESFMEIRLEGKDYFLVVYELEHNGWKVLTLIGKAEVLMGLRPFYMGMITMMSLTFAASIVVIYTILKKSLAPYKLLTQFADAIEQGQYHIRVPEAFLMRQDELGMVSNSFERVLEKLHGENIELEERIAIKNKELETQYRYILETEKVASLGALVAGVAHEINTPLGIAIASESYIHMMTDQALEKLSSGHMSKSDLKQFFEDLEKSSLLMENNLQRAADMVKSFKNIAVYQTGDMKERFSIKSIVEDVLLSCHSLYKHKPIEFIVQEVDILFESYPGIFTQILTNLLVNAVTHGFKHKEKGVITIDYTLGTQFLHIHFSDDGEGVAEDRLNKIFEPFYTTNREAGNSGLGLNIVFNLVHQVLGGTIKASINAQGGLSFDIDIPQS